MVNTTACSYAYNRLIKIDGWFGSEIRVAIQEKGNRSDCRDGRKTG